MDTQTSYEQEVIQPTGCCPPFDPLPWEGRELTWHEKPFVRDHVMCLFHVPINMGHRVLENMTRIEAAHAAAEHPLMLCDERSPWGEDIFIEVKHAVPGATMDQLSGTFLTMVFEGPFRDVGKWAHQMKEHVASKGRILEKLYFGYTTCPKCAKAYGKNYVVLFAKVNAVE